MTTFVLMHGGGMGGWTWKDVRRILRDAGNEVFTPSYTGFAEREHLSSREIDNSVHVTDIVNLLRYEDLNDVVLVAHSYSGTIVPGVVRQVPERVRRAIYLDAIVARSGERVASCVGMMAEADAAGLDAMLARGEGPVGSGVHEQQRAMAAEHPMDMTPERQAWLLAHLSDMPLRCSVSTIAVGAETLAIPVDYVKAQNTIMAPMHSRAADLGWTMHHHKGDHGFLVGYPEDTAALIAEIAG